MEIVCVHTIMDCFLWRKACETLQYSIFCILIFILYNFHLYSNFAINIKRSFLKAVYVFQMFGVFFGFYIPVPFCSIFRTHVHDEDHKLMELNDTSILNISAL